MGAMGEMGATPGTGRVTGNWWALALRAVAAILLGILALSRPGITLAALLVLFGVYAMADGIFAVVAAIRGIREREPWGWMMFEGIVGIIAGAIALFAPQIGALALVWLVAGWALATGVLEIAAAVKLRKIMKGEWMLLLAGVLSIIFALIIAARPGLGVLALVFWIGAYAIIYGVMTMVLAFEVRRWTKDHTYAASHV
jgi:uncharacterized membrane protein HdeD (DUF308 family)